MANLRIILADDHPFVLLGLKSTLKRCEGLSVVGEARTPTALIAMLQRTPCDVLSVDLSMPEPAGEIGDGIAMIRRIRRAWPSLRVVVVTAQTDAAMLRVIASDGAVSVIGKTDSLDELPRAITESARGARYLGRSVAETLARSKQDNGVLVSALLLSKRQTDILRRLVNGESIAQIAMALGCNRRTVSRQKREAMARLGVTDDPALFACVRACGTLLLEPEN
ncbi:response regulator transcription factor [Paraburkholderia sp. MMS20-SJTN17]|uniref:Response regulator transcription factor n=1 Tax=Paraburkholderia translucens TaxID=2886945 RepID=A0ABS8KIE5_9BURK|nr:response regulator transcription factor [Paraburkholderia sp. MMS20-SJTN17]MCC8404204.1 response regulator transcription factor [Paraburkholderia sp. MMS20-SJTN17]